MKKTTRFETELRQFEDEMMRRRWRPNTRRAYVRGARLFLEWIERTDPIDALEEISEETILGWRDELKSWSVAPSTQALRLAGVKSFFFLLASVGVLRSDPASEVFSGKKIRRADRRAVITPVEAALMVEAANASARSEVIGLRDAAVVELLYSTGVRGFELRALKVGDVDLQNQTVTVLRGKNGRSRTVPLGAEAVVAIGAYLAQSRSRLSNRRTRDELILSWKGTAISPQTLARIVHLSSCGIARKVTPHRLRHACATHLLENGAELEEVRQMLGHSSLDTTSIYAQTKPRELSEVHREFHPRG